MMNNPVKNLVDKVLKNNPIFKAFKDAEKIPQTKFIGKLPENQWQGVGAENANFNAGGAFYGVEEIPRRKGYRITTYYSEKEDPKKSGMIKYDANCMPNQEIGWNIYVKTLEDFEHGGDALMKVLYGLGLEDYKTYKEFKDAQKVQSDME